MVIWGRFEEDLKKFLRISLGHSERKAQQMYCTLIPHNHVTDPDLSHGVYQVGTFCVLEEIVIKRISSSQWYPEVAFAWHFVQSMTLLPRGASHACDFLRALVISSSHVRDKS